jgi:hypothetical protein
VDAIVTANAVAENAAVPAARARAEINLLAVKPTANKIYLKILAIP